MAESNLTYKRRDGIDSDHGVCFEWQTTNLAYLRCEKLYRQWVQENTSGVKSYIVANNVDGIGAFDDVVIRAEYPHQNEDKTKLIFVQCKHFINPKKCLLENLLKCAMVQKYFDSFMEVLRILNDHRALSCQTYKEIEIRKKAKRQRTQENDTNTEKEQKLRNIFQCKPQDCEFILYSNIILEAGFENTQYQQDNDIAMKILNTARSNEFNILLNAMQLEFLSNEQLVDSREMFLELKQEFAAKFRIIVNQVENYNSDVLKSIKATADIGSISPLLDEEIKLMFKNEPCIAITQNSELLENIENFSKLKTKAKIELESFLHISEHGNLFLNEFIENWQNQFDNEEQTKICTSSIQLEKLKLKQYFTNKVQERKLLVFIKDENDLRIWTKAQKSRLYRNFDHIFVCLENMNMFSGYAKDNNEVFIEILQNNENDSSFNFAQFSHETSKLILNHAIIFQGYTVTVNDICGYEWRSLLDEETTCKILRGEEITIGSKFFDSLDCYMERKLQMKEKNEENSYRVNQLQIMNKYGKSDTKTLTEDDIIEEENKKVFLLTGPAGIGKSTTLKSLALKYKNKNPKYFVYLIELNKYLNVLKKYKEDCDGSCAIEFLAQKILSLQQLEYRLFVYACAENKNVALFFDAFDEISPDGEKKFSSFLETLLKAHVSSIFVSSRPNFIGSLEQRLKQESLIFVPFSLDDKNFFFLKYYEKLTKQNATSNDTEEMKNVISRIIKTMEENTELMAIPLQITMLAEIHFEKFSEMTTEEKMSFSIKMDICSLYNAFIEKLVERYLVEKKKLILQDEEKIIAIRDEMRDAEELACKLICPDINQTPLTKYSDAILKMCNQIGLITNIDPPVFLHRTYGEFLAASFFVKSIMNENKNSSAEVSFMCKNVLIKYEYADIRRFINAILCNLNSRENDSYIINPGVKILSDYFCNETSLHVAAEEKHAQIVKLLVQNDPSKLNDLDDNGHTAVEIACQSGCFKSVEILYLNNCITNVKNVDRETVLHCAAKGNYSFDSFFSLARSNSIRNCWEEQPRSENLEINPREIKDIIHFILEKDKTLLTKTNIKGDTAFSVACECNNVEAVMCLLKIDNDLVNIVDECGNLPLHYAAKNGYIQIVKEILSHKSNLINIKNNDGLFPLHIACKDNHIEVARYLLTQKSSLVSMKCGEKEETPLHFAARNGNVELMLLLLQHDQTLLNTCNLNGESPLFCALMNLNTAAAKLLLKFPNCVINKGLNPLILAARIGDVELMNDLLHHDQTLLNMCNLDEESPLLCAFFQKQNEVVKFLLKSPHWVVNKGETPLTLAAKIGDLELMTLILQHDQSLLNNLNLNGESPLFCALMNLNTAAAKLLLKFPNCVVETGGNPLAIAARIGDVDLLSKIYSLDCTLLNKVESSSLKYSPLHIALISSNIKAAIFLLQLPECSLMVDSRGRSPFHYAAEKGYMEIIKLLINKDRSLLLKQDIIGKSALYYAIGQGQTEVACTLLSCDEYYVEDNNLQNELETAIATNESFEIIILMLERKPTLINKRNSEELLPLDIACKWNNTEAVNYLLSRTNSTLILKGERNDSILHFAATTGNLIITNLIMEKFPQLLNQKDSHGSTAMHYACKYNNTEVEKIFLSHYNCQINVHDDEHQNPLHYASKRSNLEVMKMLLDLDISLLNIQNIKGQTPLHLTLIYGDEFDYFTGQKIDKNDFIEAAKYLLSLNCSVNVQDVNGKTPLHLASMHFNVEIIKLLLERNETLLNQQDKDGRTPLHCVFADLKTESFVTTWYETLSCLLNFPECDINLTDNNGNTPLHLAAGHLNYDDDDDELLPFFIQRDGLQLNVQNNMGQTALHLAAKLCNSEKIKVFLSHKECKANTQDINGDTPLHSCIRVWLDNEVMSTMIDLIKHDSSILNIKNHIGQTPLHAAVKEHEFKVVDLLVRFGADVNIKDNDNHTPLELARWLAADEEDDDEEDDDEEDDDEEDDEEEDDDEEDDDEEDDDKLDDYEKYKNRKIIETLCLQSAGTATTEPPSGVEEIE